MMMIKIVQPCCPKIDFTRASPGEEQAAGPWQARQVQDRVSEGHEQGFQVYDPAEWEVGEDRVENQHLPAFSLKKTTFL